MKHLLWCGILIAVAAGCKQKKKKTVDTSEYIPILSFLQSQVKKIDTSMYFIRKIEVADGRSDTTVISREEVRKLAADFLDIPDVRKPEYGSNYEENRLYDSPMVVITYLATEEDIDVPRQEVYIVPTYSDNDQIKTVYAEKSEGTENNSVRKKMVWETDRFFQIRTITEKKGEGEKIRELKIIWQDRPAD